MSINPSATNYAPFQGSYNNNQTAMFAAPGEGSRAIPASITWTQYPMNIVSGIRFNCAPQGPNIGLSQIGTLYVDNTQCAHNLTAFFPDTGHQIEINAFSAGFFPVISNATNFILAVSESQPPGVTSFVVGEVTLLQILNVFAPPSLLNESPINVAIAQPILVNPASETDVHNNNIAIPTTGSVTTNLITTGSSLHVVGFDLTITNTTYGAGGGAIAIDLIEDVATVIWEAQIIGGANAFLGNYLLLINKQGLYLPSVSGLIKLTLNTFSGSVAAGGFLSINVYYTTP